MNKLQIIAEIFGDKFCPKASFSHSENYSAVMRDKGNVWEWISPDNTQKIFSKAVESNVRIGIDFGRQQFDIYFND